MAQFKSELNPINEVIPIALTRLGEAQKMVENTCHGFHCDTCPLYTEENIEGYSCSWIHVESGYTAHLTTLQKEILACIAIFGRYPIEEEK